MLEPETNFLYFFFQEQFFWKGIKQLLSHLISFVDNSLYNESLDKLSVVQLS